jgi:hypothetical protein
MEGLAMIKNDIFKGILREWPLKSNFSLFLQKFLSTLKLKNYPFSIEIWYEYGRAYQLGHQNAGILLTERVKRMYTDGEASNIDESDRIQFACITDNVSTPCCSLKTFPSSNKTRYWPTSCMNQLFQYTNNSVIFAATQSLLLHWSDLKLP